MTIVRLLAGFREVLASPRHNHWKWLETIVIPLGAVALSASIQPDDPLLVRADFSWVFLAPILVALRYGMVAGAVSSLILLLTWGVSNYFSVFPAAFPEQFFLGWVLVTLLCGEFSDLWQTRIRRATEINQYLDNRLSQITHRHLLLRLSHDQLEEELLTRPVTLRDALRELRLLSHHQDRASSDQALLQLLVRYCQLESAAIYTLTSNGGLELTSQIDSPPRLRPDDALLAYALEHRALAHVCLDQLASTVPSSPFLVIAPFPSSTKQTTGVLAIERMPFLALNQENLQLLAVLLGYYADCVNEPEGTKQFRRLFPDAPADFAAEFSRLMQLQRTHGINSHIVVLSFKNDLYGQQAVARIQHSQRSLDVAWSRNDGRHLLFVNLMPLATEVAVKGYLLRVNSILRELDDFKIEGERFSRVSISMANDDPLAAFKKVLESHHG